MQVDKAKPPSATPRWVKFERLLVCLSGLSVCAAIWTWSSPEGWGADSPPIEHGTLALATAAVFYAALLAPLLKAHEHKVPHLVIFALALVVWPASVP